MKIVIQKTHKCILSVNDSKISEIGHGLLVFVGVNKNDTMDTVVYMAKKIANMRLFKDENDKINKSVKDVDGEIMVVSNFTLNAAISSGTRPSFSDSATPEIANQLYLALAEEFRKNNVKNVVTGSFGEHMHLETLLDGPFNIVIEK
ncbi:MAG: D-tyrosyl-tRNA(Tyr) deacylase [Clostridia bacterium]|nr:D-tyrosyl-tRNA(Tyr) deacylase [Clostridia bacterium]